MYTYAKMWKRLWRERLRMDFGPGQDPARFDGAGFDLGAIMSFGRK
jgi:hypothetical protein